MGAATTRWEVRSGSARLAGERTGEGGPEVVLLHAGVADRRSWAGVAERLAAGATVTSYDRRGFGETIAPPERHAHAADLARVLEARSAAPVWLVGSSQGGRVALDLALGAPERVAGLVLVSPAVSGAPEPERLSPAEQRLGDLIDEAWEAGELERVNSYETHLWLDGPEQPEGRVSGPARELVLDMNGKALAAPDPGEEIEPPRAHDRLHELGVPTLVVWGDLDLGPVQELSAYVAEQIPGARRHIMSGTAHLPYLERPAELTDRAEALIRS